MNTLIPLITLLLTQTADVEKTQLSLPGVDGMLADLRPVRPRVLASQGDFDRVRRLIESDKRAERWYAAVKRRGQRMLKAPPTAYDIPDGIRLLQQSRRTLERAVTLGLLYRLEGDVRCRDRIWQDLEAAAGFSDWNPRHFLDVGEMTCAFAVAYDWLYDAWSDEQRAVIRDALVTHGLQTALKGYRAERQPWWVRSTNNWNQVCNGGIAIGAIAVADELPRLAGEVLHHALGSLPPAVASFAPDGACVEGPGYWAYATRYYTYLLATLDNGFGRDFGLSELPAVDRLGDFPLLLRSPTNRTFNFADCGQRTPVDACLLWLAQRFDRPEWALYQVELTKGSALDLLWYRPELAGADVGRLPLDAHFRHIDALVMRSAWGDDSAWYLGCKAGDNRFPHGNLDIGSFVLEALGERWAEDLGADNYNLPGYWASGRGGRRWTYYRLRAQGHNTLVIRPGEHDDQVATAVGRVLDFESKPERASTTIDMTAAYADWATRAHRTFELSRAVGAEATVTVRDELELKQAEDVYWLMHTKADIEADNRRARLKRNGKTLYAHLISPADASFSVLDAAPLPGTPDPERQAQNDGVRRLAIRLEQATAPRIAVVFSAVSEVPPIAKAESGAQARMREIAADGAWCWFGDPRAVYHAGQRKRTYVGWVTRAGDIRIGALDHETGDLESATLHEKLNPDDHANPSLLVRPDGRIMVFYTAHSLADVPMRVVVSERPEDIRAWQAPVEIRANAAGRGVFCYPNPVQLSAESHRLFLFWRGGNSKPDYATSADAENWTAARTFIEGRKEDHGNRPYCKYATNGRDRIDVAFTTGHPRNEPQNSIYYVSYRDGNLFRADGTRIKALEDGPVSYAEADLVYDAHVHGARAWIWDIAIDAVGRPVIVFAACPAEPDHRYHYAHWNGQKWVDHEICVAGGWFPQTPDGQREREPHYSGGIVLDHQDPTIAYLSRQRDGVFEIERWTTKDGGRRWRSAPITHGSSKGNVRPFVARSHPADAPGLFWMHGDYVHYLDFQTSLRMATRQPDSTISGEEHVGRPYGYELAYQQHFSARAGLDDYVFSEASAWRIGEVAGDACLELGATSRYAPPHASPKSIAVLAAPAVGSFVLEADLMQTGREYAHRDLCVFFGLRDAAHYYYAHIATQADDVSHQVHIVDGAARRPITAERSDGVDWGRDRWHRVRVERDIDSGIVQVYFDNLEKPVLTARDVTFGAGFVGFGSFDDVGRVDNVRLWAQASKPRRFAGFGRESEK
jgi:hypothetical protein